MINTKNIKEIMELFEASDLAKMEVESEGLRIQMEKPSANISNVGIPMQQGLTQSVSVPTSNVVPETKEETGYWVKAPIVGTYYQSRTPGGTAFVEIGQHVKKGDVLCIIEAMKVMNEIHSPVDGVIMDILLTQESMVEFDQQLIRIGEDA